VTPLELETPRLRLRAWRDSDRAPFAALNADPRVMEFFPSTQTREESDAAAELIRSRMAELGWGLWAAEVPGVSPFIGFIGLNVVAPHYPVEPKVEIGWRLAAEHWGKGYATEGARAALAAGFERLGFPEIVAYTAVKNARSRAVMEKIGMRFTGETFEHPNIAAGHPLRTHVLYRLKRGGRM
jgi:RimJ/RimL family protein N-acetyltransferase